MEIDKQTIKALSADARVRILKILCENRKIAADISRAVGLAPSTINEHLKLMEEAGLVKKNDTGHKWVYYDITEKGRGLIRPKLPVNIILTLTIGTALVFAGAANFYATYKLNVATALQSAAEKAAAIAEQGAAASQGIGQAPAAINWISAAVLIAGSALVAFSLLKIRKKRSGGFEGKG